MLDVKKEFFDFIECFINSYCITENMISDVLKIRTDTFLRVETG
jgi:hypothetical protein